MEGISVWKVNMLQHPSTFKRTTDSTAVCVEECVCVCVYACARAHACVYMHRQLIRVNLEHSDVTILDMIQASTVQGCLDARKCNHTRTDVFTTDDHEESAED